MSILQIHILLDNKDDTVGL